MGGRVSVTGPEVPLVDSRPPEVNILAADEEAPRLAGQMAPGVKSEEVSQSDEGGRSAKWEKSDGPTEGSQSARRDDEQAPQKKGENIEVTNGKVSESREEAEGIPPPIEVVREQFRANGGLGPRLLKSTESMPPIGAKRHSMFDIRRFARIDAAGGIEIVSADRVEVSQSMEFSPSSPPGGCPDFHSQLSPSSSPRQPHSTPCSPLTSQSPMVIRHPSVHHRLGLFRPRAATMTTVDVAAVHAADSDPRTRRSPSRLIWEGLEELRHHSTYTRVRTSRRSSLKEEHIARRQLTLLSQPLRTLELFFAMVWRCVHAAFYAFVLHWATRQIVLPGAAVLFGLSQTPGPHREVLTWVWRMVKLTMWWGGLGVLSSVGLGCGIHSGLLFLFPHIFSICATAEACNSLNFDSFSDMWGGRLDPGDLFECREVLPSKSFTSEVTFAGLFWTHVFPAAFLWGLGTAVGELPPYAASYAAAKARREDDDFEDLAAEIEEETDSLFTRLKKLLMFGMVVMIEQYGAVAVFLFSCWPNALFDLCGIVCGHFMMPFWSFFIALTLGKAVVKVATQCGILIILFSNRLFDKAPIISKLVQIPPLSILIRKKIGGPAEVEALLHREIQRLSQGGGKRTEGRWWFLSLSGLFRFGVLLAVGYFTVSLIEQFAQMRQKELDEALRSQRSSVDCGSSCVSESEASTVTCRPHEGPPLQTNSSSSVDSGT